MKPEFETHLRDRFSELRRAEHEAAPLWSLPELPRPSQRIIHRDPDLHLRWAVPVLIAAVLLFWIKPTQESLADLPAWSEPSPGQLFADISTSPSTDFLLPTHLNIKLP
jgi:hypothetical protein